jgi:hypothetical protein
MATLSEILRQTQRMMWPSANGLRLWPEALALHSVHVRGISTVAAIQRIHAIDLRMPTMAMLYEGYRGQIEHLCHELLHAVSLGLDMSNRVEYSIANRLNERADNGAFNEALVLASEGVLFEMLGDRIDARQLENAATDQFAREQYDSICSRRGRWRVVKLASQGLEALRAMKIATV